MKFFKTPVQHRILQSFWDSNTPFTLDELLDKKVIHFRVPGKIILAFMRRLGQVLPCGAVDGQTQYIGTTDSEEEWNSIKKEKQHLDFFWMEDDGVLGLNRYEATEVLLEIEKLIEKKRASMKDK